MRTNEERAANVTRMYEARERRDLLLQAGLWFVALAAILLLGPLLAGNGCGDTAFGDEREGPGSVPTARVADGPRPDAPARGALALAARMRSWQPRVRVSDEGLLVLASAIVQATSEEPWPSPWLVSGVAFRESGWRVSAIGARGELGAMQVHGAALAGHTRAQALEPATNVRLGVRWLRHAWAVCERAGWQDRIEERALTKYAGAGCRTSVGARRAMRYAMELQGAGDRS